MPGTIVRPQIWQDRPGPADTDSHGSPLWRRFSPFPVAPPRDVRQAPWVGRAEPSDAACLPAGSAVVVLGGGSRGGRRDRGGDVKEWVGGVAEGWRTSRCDRRLTADPRAAPVLSRAPRRRGPGARRGLARPPGGAAPSLRPWSQWLLFHVEQRQFGGACSLASATPRQHRRRVMACAGASGPGARAGPHDVPRGTSGDLPAPRAARPPRKGGRGPPGRP